MRRTKRNGSFLLCLLFNMLLNLEGLIPAAILLVLHFWLGWSVWWAVIAAVIWILGMIVWMMLVGWLSKYDSVPLSQNKNKNPPSEINENKQ
ncbi:MAG: hypothetical protein ACI4XP_06175 [Acutalibacteraceae bacterium]